MTDQVNNTGQSGESRAAGRISGWLLVYFIMSVIFDVAAVVLLFTSRSELTSDRDELGLLALMVAAGCVMTGYLIAAFIKRKPDAAFLGKHHTVINAIPAACVLIWLINRIDQTIFTVLFYVLLLGGVAVWRLFFGSSSQVDALIPPATRKVAIREKHLVTFLYVAVGVALFFNADWSRWWTTLFGICGLLSLSPLFSDLDNEQQQQE